MTTQFMSYLSILIPEQVGFAKSHGVESQLTVTTKCHSKFTKCFLSFAVYLICVVLCLRYTPYIYEIQLFDFIRILILQSGIPYIPPLTKFVTLTFQMLITVLLRTTH